MRRLALASVKEVSRLKLLVFDGHALAAMELAEIYKVKRLEDLLLVVTVHRGKHIGIFDACADGFALYQATAVRKERTVV